MRIELKHINNNQTYFSEITVKIRMAYVYILILVAGAVYAGTLGIGLSWCHKTIREFGIYCN